MNFLLKILLSGFFLLFSACSSDGDPAKQQDGPIPIVENAVAFPGAEGFGRDATGGRGGKVLFVTNLNDSGAGSFRTAVQTTGPRIVVFKISGNIKLLSPINITTGDLTIAGQTAPGDGICIQDYEVMIAASNVIIRFIRFRVGDVKQQESDAIWGRYQQNVILDHCSMSWSVDECASFYANKNFTLQWCILSESLNQSFHDKGDHGYGAIWGGDKASFHHNLLAHHNSRNPRFNGGGRSGISNGIYMNEHVDYRNNVIYNWRGNSAYGGENGNYNIINNYYKQGPATPASKNKRIMEVSKEPDLSYGAGYGKFFIAGNYVYGNATVTSDNWSGGVDYSAGITQAMVKLSAAIDAKYDTDHTALQAFESVLNYAGASFFRDAVDTRIVNETRNGTATYSGSKTGYAGILDSQADAGGWPVLANSPAQADTDNDGMPDAWELDMLLDPNKSDASGRNLSTGYDNIEVYINSIVKNITAEQKK